MKRMKEKLNLVIADMKMKTRKVKKKYEQINDLSPKFIHSNDRFASHLNFHFPLHTHRIEIDNRLIIIFVSIQLFMK